MLRPIVFQYDSSRAAQAVLWLLHKHGGAMDKLKLVKLVFYADRDHIAKFGRPIAGGPYVAMKHGPVSSKLLNDLAQAAPGAGYPFEARGRRVLALSQVDENELSESDMSVLEAVNAQYGNLDTFRLRDLTHELKAWRKNYPDPKANTSHPLPYEDFFLDLDDDGILKIIRDHQQAMDF
jgi:uncharacterized phage-associated protein